MQDKCPYLAEALSGVTAPKWGGRGVVGWKEFKRKEIRDGRFSEPMGFH
jgi:hypothetical protein